MWVVKQKSETLINTQCFKNVSPRANKFIPETYHTCKYSIIEQWVAMELLVSCFTIRKLHLFRDTCFTNVHK